MAKDTALYNLIRKAALSRGASGLVADLVASQVMYETTDGTSNVSQKDTNYSGIKWAKQKNAVPGTMSPEGNRYAKFKTFGDWFDAYIKELKKGPGKPWMASSIDDYILKLKENRYYSDTVDRYGRNLKAVYKKYQPDKKEPLTAQRDKVDIFNPKRDDKRVMRNNAQEEVRDGTWKTIQRKSEIWKEGGTVPGEVDPYPEKDFWNDKKLKNMGIVALVSFIIYKAIND